MIRVYRMYGKFSMKCSIERKSIEIDKQDTRFRMSQYSCRVGSTCFVRDFLIDRRIANVASEDRMAYGHVSKLVWFP